ncbi:MAG TPA: hypothetical protein VHV27_00100 [Phenylobacterium sp.]|nr:hypothetical protein [Phenylobacterium sp.]
MRRLILLTVAIALAATTAQAAGYRAPRTSSGAPDLQGIWTNASLTFLQRPPIFKGLVATDAEEAMMVGGFKKMAGNLLDPTSDPKAPAPPKVDEAPQADILEMPLALAKVDGQKRSSWIVDPKDGKIPFSVVGRAARKVAVAESYDGPEGRPLSERCLVAVGSPEGPPMMNTGFNANYQIIQTRDYVAIEIEMNHDVRIIRMTDRKHVPDAIRPWMGDSVGWWDGDTLVVETTNLNPKTSIDALFGGFNYSPKGRLIERFTRVSPTEMIYEFTVDDPAYFTRTWSAQMPMRATNGPIYEYACHEGNYSLPNALSGARAEERAAAAAPGPAAPAKVARAR